MRRLGLLVAVAAGVTACGDGGDAPAPVEGSLRLERPPAAGADAGTSRATTDPTGWRRRARATSSCAAVCGRPRARWQCASSTAGRASARVAPDGAFAVTLVGLRPGRNRFALRATSSGRAAWRADFVVVRR